MSIEPIENLLEIVAEGLPVLRVKKSKILKPEVLTFDQNNYLSYKKEKKVTECLSNKASKGFD